MNKFSRKILTAILTGIMVIGTLSITAFAEDPTTAANDTSKEEGYGAYVNCQTTTWVYRNVWYDTAESGGPGSDKWDVVFDNESSTATNTIVNDTKIDGDGEYTLSLTNVDLKGSTDWNILGFSTNIPLSANLKIESAALYYDDVLVTDQFSQKNDKQDVEKDYVHILFINQYDKAMADVSTMVPADGQKIIMKFTISGFGYDKTFEDPTTEEVTEAPTTSVTATTANTAASTADKSSSKGLPIIAIVGIVAGVVVVIIVVVVVAVTASAKKKNR